MLAQRNGWEIGYQDEVWWSRVSQPNLHSWGEKDEPLRLQELAAEKNDPDPKALACYGMLSATSGRMHLRFVSGRPVSQVTTDFLEWLCEQVQAQGKHVLVLIWDNASWHVSKQVKTCGKLGQICTNFEVKQRKSARIVGIDHSGPGETAPHLVYFS